MSILTSNQKLMSLSDFKLDIATWLLSCNKCTPKRGRPNQQDNHPKKRRKSVHPAEFVRRDGSSHLPSCVKTKQRCMQCVHKFTRVICTKCNVGLFTK